MDVLTWAKVNLKKTIFNSLISVVTIKNRKMSDKNKGQDTIKKNINFVSLLAKAGLQVSIFLGVLITLIYCGRIGYFPSMLTLGDSFFLIAVSLAFAVVHLMFVYLLLSAGIVISPFFRKIQSLVVAVLNSRSRSSKEYQELINIPELKSIYLVESIMGLISLLIITVITIIDYKQGLYLVLSAVIFSFIFGLWNTKIRVRGSNFNKVWQIKLVLVLFSLTVPIYLGKLGGDFLNISMSMIGVRSNANTVLISDDHAKLLSYYQIEKVKNNNDANIYEDVQILFQGIGDKTVLKFGDFKLTVRSNEIIVGKKVEEEK